MKTSVIIPSKNGLHHLKECLPSVINAAQKAPFETEIIVIDDNSNDNTFEILPQIYSKIKVLKNPKQGASSARNFAVKNSSGNWLLFIMGGYFLRSNLQSRRKQDQHLLLRLRVINLRRNFSRLNRRDQKI